MTKLYSYKYSRLFILVFLLCSWGFVLPVSADYKNTQFDRKLFFGHQSVGLNIIDGLQLINKNIKIYDIRDLNSSSGPGFYHSKVGKNNNPASKIESFKLHISNKHQYLDLVALKFCYVDIHKDADIESIFSDYVAMVEEINQKFPDLEVIHFTVPLTTNKTSWKTVVKSLLGKSSWEYADNIKRNEYNKKIKEKYENDKIFDISYYEALNPDKTEETFKENGNTYYAMSDAYTNDGGHLNTQGQKWIAENLLNFLDEID